MFQIDERIVRTSGPVLSLERKRAWGGINGKQFIHPRFSPEVSSDGVDRQQVDPAVICRG